MKDPKLSIVIPCYNEAAGLPSLIERLESLPWAEEQAEVIVVDNGSTDDTQHIFPEILRAGGAIRSVRVEENQGYGHGILFGLSHARGQVMGWTHADLQTDPADVLKGWAHFKYARKPERYFVKGRRYGRPLFDVMFTTGMSIFELLILQRLMWDVNAQPTLFPRQLYESWGPRAPKDFSLDLYAYYTALEQGYLIERFSALFAERKYGVSSWNTSWREKWKFIKRTTDFSFALRESLDN